MKSNGFFTVSSISMSSSSYCYSSILDYFLFLSAYFFRIVYSLTPLNNLFK